jgi:hypothetical protein
MIKLQRLQTKVSVTQLWECDTFEANFKYLSFAVIVFGCKVSVFFVAIFAKPLFFPAICKVSILQQFIQKPFGLSQLAY